MVDGERRQDKKRGGKGRESGLLAWMLEIHWWEGGPADFVIWVWLRVEKVLFDGAEELILDGEVFVVVEGFCCAAGVLELAEIEMGACTRSIPYI